MKLTLIDYTGRGTPNPARYAAELLVFTKRTRLTMDVDGLTAVAAMSDEEIEAELQYMARTIPSSWEFVSYTFLVQDVTRAFTHQFVRTRTGSYAQQTMRVLNVDGWTYETGPSIEGGAQETAELYHDTMATIAAAYQMLIELGAEIEDARGVLPTNIHTNIVAKFDLRTLVTTLRKRASHRTQSEYRAVMDALRAAICDVHPWAAIFLDRDVDRVFKEIEEVGQCLYDSVAPGARTRLMKLVDELRGMI